MESLHEYFRQHPFIKHIPQPAQTQSNNDTTPIRTMAASEQPSPNESPQTRGS